MDKLLKSRPDMAKDVAFEKSRQPANKIFSATFEDEVERLVNSPKTLNIMVIDKNHPPNSLMKISGEVDNFKRKWRCNCIKILLAPHCGYPRIRDSPFSY